MSLDLIVERTKEKIKAEIDSLVVEAVYDACGLVEFLDKIDASDDVEPRESQDPNDVTPE